ncbi:MAG: hypothetical protein D6719_11020 [Candidatus Dadabacteria bacterium]|nr:MAG: hypothetical protein D6719_11020 [Candidatus Dadabacteria bacterium]
MAEEKSHKPTPERLKKARKEGKVLKSQLVTKAATTVAFGLCALYYFSSTWVSNKMLLEYIWTEGFLVPAQIFEIACEFLLDVTLLIFCVTAFTGVLAEVVQTGFWVEWSLLASKAERLNPIKGLGRIAGSLKKAWLPALKLLILVFCFLWFIPPLLRSVVFFTAAGLLSSRWMTVLVFGSFGLIALTLVVAAGIDYLIKRRDYFTKLSMSDDEIRREVKDLQGDPLQKSIRRALHQEYLSLDIVSRIRRARVIVVEKNDNNQKSF